MEKRIVQHLLFSFLWIWQTDVGSALYFYNLPNNQLVEENTRVGTSVFAIQIQNDTGNDLVVWWSPSHAEGSALFSLGSVESSEIVVSTQSALDYEMLTVTSFTFMVVISDHTEGLTATSTLTLSVGDVNERVTWVSDSYSTSVPDGAAVGHVVQDPGFDFIDPDVGDSATCSMNCRRHNGFFSMSTSCNITVTSPYTLDTRGSSDSFECNVVVVDGDSHSATATLTISIVDVNNHQPVFDSSSYQFTITPYLDADRNIGRVRAADRDTGTYGEITYRLDQSMYPTHYFKIDSNTGQISTQLTMSTCNCPVSTFSMPVHATDHGGLVGSSIVHITTDVTTTTTSPTTTTPTTTTAAEYAKFFDNKGNVAWFSILLVLLAVTVCVTGLILLKYGCRSFWFTRRNSKKIWTKRDKCRAVSVPASIRRAPPPAFFQAWRHEQC